MRIIGDIHGNQPSYFHLIKDVEHSIQLGDMGFDYDFLKDVSINHRFIGGNHDNYELLKAGQKNYLGDYGIYNNIGFIRGAKSIDKHHRLVGLSWWEEEELNYREAMACIDFFSSANKPEIMITHDCPKFVAKVMFGIEDNSSTRCLLDIIYSIVKPKLWFFGHHHRNMIHLHDDTVFQCVKDNDYVDLNYCF